MSISAGLSNVFVDAYRLIEANLTPFEINNLRIATKRPQLDLSLCTIEQVVQGIECGVDFRFLPVYLRPRTGICEYTHIYYFIYDCGRAIEKRGDNLGYKWLCRITMVYSDDAIAYDDLVMMLLMLDNVPETNYDLAEQVIDEYLESSQVDHWDMLSSLDNIVEYAKDQGNEVTCAVVDILKDTIINYVYNYIY